jgi:hypothetical protein
LSISQLFTSFYLTDNFFTNEIESHLSDIIDIKSERINDYLIERNKNTLILSNSKQVKDILKYELEFNMEVSKNNINSQLNILSKQINLFLLRNPHLILEDLKKNSEFKSLFIKTIGIDGSSVILDLNSKKVIQSSNSLIIDKYFSNINNGFYEEIIDTRAKTSDGYSIGISAITYKNDFKILSEDSYDLKKSLNRFTQIYNYENLILISPDNYVIYQNKENYELGSNLKFSNSDLSLTFSKIYDLSNQLDNNKVSIIGPYFENGNIDAKLLMAFGIPVVENNKFLGTLILLVSMNEIENIISENNNLGSTSETYLINQNELLITKLKNQNFDILVQEIKTENSRKCLNKYLKDDLSYYENSQGDLVLGSYGLINQVNWCLISEVNYDDVSNSSKSGQILSDTLFIVILLFVLLFNIIILNNSLKKSNLTLNKDVSKEKLLFKFGIYFYLSSKILYLIKSNFYDTTIITISIIFITILEFIGLYLIFLSIKSFGGFKK